MPPYRTPPETVAEVWQFHSEGYKNYQIAALIGVHRRTVARILRNTPIMPSVAVPDADECEPYWCDMCKAMVTTRPCIACRTRWWVAHQP